MAVDKKSDYVGTHGGAYVDNGMSKQFTYVDHDIKTKIYVPSGPNKDVEKVKIERSELEKLADTIVHVGMDSNKEFIKAYDELGKKYGFERFDKSIGVKHVQLTSPHNNVDYLRDLIDIYEHIHRASQEGQTKTS